MMSNGNELYLVIQNTTKVLDNVWHLSDLLAALFKLRSHSVTPCDVS